MTVPVADVMALARPHFRMRSGVSWRLSASGIVVGSADAADRTPGPPATVRRVWAWFGPAIVASSLTWGVPVELIVACLCAETARSDQQHPGQMSRALRKEPGYVSAEATPDRVSAGCMQTLLSTARSVLGEQVSIDDLMDPACSIDAGTGYIAHQAGVGLHAYTGFDPPLVAAAYNAGGLYPDRSEANRWRLRCYPIGTGAHIDRFVLWFNDAMSLGSGPAGRASSFARAAVALRL